MVDVQEPARVVNLHGGPETLGRVEPQEVEVGSAGLDPGAQGLDGPLLELLKLRVERLDDEDVRVEDRGAGLVGEVVELPPHLGPVRLDGEPLGVLAVGGALLE